MLKFKLKKALISLLSIIIITNSSNCFGYVCGYTKLILPKTESKSGKRIDLIYDFHVPKDQVSNRRTWINNCYLSEKTTYNFLKQLDQEKANVDILWENHNDSHIQHGLFITYAPKIRSELNNIDITYSDIERHNFERLIFCPKNGIQKPNLLKPINSNQASLNLSKANLNFSKKVDPNMLNIIEQNYGHDSKNYFKDIFTQNRKNLEDLLTLPSFISLDYLLQNTDFNRITDIEMLGNILKSNKERVVIYAGCFHCRAIKEELQKFGYKLAKSSEQDYSDSCFYRPKQFNAEKLKSYLA